MSGLFEGIGGSVGGAIAGGASGVVQGLPGAVAGGAAGGAIGAAAGASVGVLAGAGTGGVTIPVTGAGGLAGGAVIGSAVGAGAGFAPGFSQGYRDGYGPGSAIGGGYGRAVDDTWLGKKLNAMVKGYDEANKANDENKKECTKNCASSKDDPREKNKDRQAKDRERWEKTLDNIKEHTTNKDLDGARREPNGEIVKTKSDVMPWDHIQEVRDAQNGLEDIVYYTK